MSGTDLIVALVQQACPADPADSRARSVEGIAEAARRGAHVVVLPELHSGPYPCFEEHPAHFDAAEPIPGPTTDVLARAAAEHGVVVVGSVFERRAPGLYHNTAVVLERDGSLVGTYRKMHIPDDPGYYEKFYFTPGDTGFEPIPTSAGRLGVLVCWDQWFPEAARLMALAGAELLVYPTAIGFAPDEDAEEQARQAAAWEIVQRGHAIANGLPLAACNRIGAEPAAHFWGRSFICGAQGEILEQAGEEARVLVAGLPTGRTESVRRMWPFLRDRRIDAYAGLAERFRDRG